MDAPLQFEKAVLDAKALFTVDIPKRQMILPWLPKGGLAMVYAHRGLGKTFFGISLAYAVTHGKEFMKWQTETLCGVLYLDGEMALRDYRERIHSFGDINPVKPLLTLNHETFYDHFFKDMDITDQEMQEFILRYSKQYGIGLLIIDNLSCLAKINENKSDAWREHLLPFLIACRRRNIAVLLIHHTGKSGDQRGTGAREDHLDVSIKLSKADDSHNDGAYFRVDFTKSRTAHGKVIKPFTAKLIENGNGFLEWSIGEVVKSTKQKLFNLIKNSGKTGITVTNAAKDLDVTKGLVSRLKKELEKQGKIRQLNGRKSPMVSNDNED